MKMKTLIEKIAENLPAKIICLVLAIFIYLIYQFSTLSKKNFAVPLSVQAAGDFVAASAPVKTIRVTVRGNSDDIIQLQENDFNAFLDLSYYTEGGSYSVPVQMRLSSQAASFSPLEVQIDPSSVPVKIEERIVSHLPILPVFTGSTADGYEVSSVKIVPDLAQVSGPRSLVEAKKTISTAAIPLNDLTASFSLKTELVNRNTLVQIEKPATVTVSVTISPKQTAKIFENVSVTLRDARKNFGLTAEPQSISVQVKAFEKQFENFVIAAEVDCSAITAPGVYELPVVVALPEGYELVKITPEKISVTAEAR